MRRYQIVVAAALFVAIAAGAAPAGADVKSATPLRVCADPNNMPFSNQKGEGIDNALARLTADALGAELQYTWLPQRRGFVRNTLKAGRCDVLMEAPVGYGRAMTTVPYYQSTYVFVSRRDRRLRLRSLDDPSLRQLRIGVQVIGDDYVNSPPAAALGSRGIAANVVGFPVYGDYAKPDPLSSIVDAVASGSVDVAIVWGPIGGWYAKSSRVRLTVTPIDPSIDDSKLRFVFAIGMAVRRGDEPLQRRLNAVIRAHRPAIASILRRFEVPTSGVNAFRGSPRRHDGRCPARR